MLAGQLGVGDGDPPRASSYTLTSIAAVVLGGASIFGGRGSFVGALLGAVLLTEVVSAVPFLQIALSWNDWIPGILILVGGRHLLAGARRSRGDARDREVAMSEAVEFRAALREALDEELAARPSR